jgi:hypothetical protein
MTNDTPSIVPGKDIRIAERTKQHTPIEDAATAAGAITPPPPAPQRIEFKRFENGTALGWQENPKKPGSFVIHDGGGTPYAIALHPGVADLICQAVTFLLHERDKAIAKRAAELAKLEDAMPSSEEIAEAIIKDAPPAAPFTVLPSPEIPKVPNE